MILNPSTICLWPPIRLKKTPTLTAEHLPCRSFKLSRSAEWPLTRGLKQDINCRGVYSNMTTPHQLMIASPTANRFKWARASRGHNMPTFKRGETVKWARRQSSGLVVRVWHPHPRRTIRFPGWWTEFKFLNISTYTWKNIYLYHRLPVRTVQPTGPALRDGGPPRTPAARCSWIFYSFLPTQKPPASPLLETPRCPAWGSLRGPGPHRCGHRRWISRVDTWWASSGLGSSLVLWIETESVVYPQQAKMMDDRNAGGSWAYHTCGDRLLHLDRTDGRLRQRRQFTHLISI